MIEVCSRPSPEYVEILCLTLLWGQMIPLLIFLINRKKALNSDDNFSTLKWINFTHSPKSASSFYITKKVMTSYIRTCFANLSKMVDIFEFDVLDGRSGAASPGHARRTSGAAAETPLRPRSGRGAVPRQVSAPWAGGKPSSDGSADGAR